jgi:large subunit ribosomal protein L39e
MGKKSFQKKMMLGKRLKRNRRIPLLAMMRTHRRLQSNKFQRDWRHRKLKLGVK